jgi:hypothetical protein
MIYFSMYFIKIKNWITVQLESTNPNNIGPMLPLGDRRPRVNECGNESECCQLSRFIRLYFLAFLAFSKFKK